MGGGSQPREYVRVSIDYRNFKLRLRSEQPGALAEVRRIVESLADQEEFSTVEEASMFELKSRLSDEFFRHPELARRVRNALVLGEEVRVLKQPVPFSRELDLETGRETLQVSVVAVKRCVASLFESVAIQRVRECLVHLRGELSREQQSLIMDSLKQRLGDGVTLRFFFTPKNLEGRVLLEGICFGEGIAEEW